MDLAKHKEELEGILDDISYELTSARTAGLDRPEQLRSSLRRARDLVADADSLASVAAAAQREEQD